MENWLIDFVNEKNFRFMTVLLLNHRDKATI